MSSDTHTGHILRECLAAERLAADIPGCTHRQARTIIGAAYDRLSLEERWEAARQMEAESESDTRDQT